MLITPRPYQTEAIDAAFSFLGQNKKEAYPLIAMPTGTGKSVVIGGIIERTLSTWPHARVLNLAHVQELVEQNHAKALAMMPLCPAGINSAGLGRRDIAPVTFASIGSVYKNADAFGHTNLVLVDEAHMVGSKTSGMYRRFISDLRGINENIAVVGLSATIYRMGVGLLTQGDFWTDVCYDITGYEAFNRLIDDGYLCPLVARPTETRYDVSQVAISNTGEYNLAQLEAVYDDNEQTRRALNEVEAFGADRRKWLIFSAGTSHAIHVHEQLRARGYEGGVLLDSTPAGVRREMLVAYKAGRLRYIVNNAILTTGFDDPAIDLIAVLRSTRSVGLWVQMLGRGTRPCDGKDNCLVLDFGDNTPRLGPINDPIIPRPKGKRKGAAPAPPIVLCPKCGCYNHALRKHCMLCGEELPERPLNLILTEQAGTADVIRRRKEDEAPQVERFDVSNVVYSKHQRDPMLPASLMVEYVCGLRFFKEFVPVEFQGSARGIALKWWKGRMRAIHGELPDYPPMPETVDEIVRTAHFLPTPKAINVHYNKRPYPEVLNHEWE